MQAQEAFDHPVSLEVQGEPLLKVLQELIAEQDAPLVFSSSLIPDQLISYQAGPGPLGTVLESLLSTTGLRYEAVGSKILILPGHPRERYQFSGFLEDAETRTRLPFAHLMRLPEQEVAFTNEYGYFNIELPSPEVNLIASFLGYQPLHLKFEIEGDSTITIRLRKDLTLSPIVVTARDSLLNLQDAVGGLFIQPEEIQRLPRIGGETDLIRTIQLFPGLQTGPDGTGGLYVRGGNAGHNLILMDGSPLYNIQHAGGLLSIFKPETLQSTQLLKSGFPARYGGRLGSVIDVKTRNGNDQRWGGQAQLGLVSGQLLLEGPITPDKSSLLVSGRWSLVDFYLEPLLAYYKGNKGKKGRANYHFHDFSFKWAHQLNERNRVFLSGYTGQDRFANFGAGRDSFLLPSTSSQGTASIYDRFQRYDEQVNWKNTALSGRWNRSLKNNISQNVLLTYSQLDINVLFEQLDSLQLRFPSDWLSYNFNQGAYASSIQEGGLHINWTKQKGPSHHLRWGLQTGLHRFQPGLLQYTEATAETADTSQRSDRLISTASWALFAEDDLRLGDRFFANLGLRYSGWHVDRKTYQALEPRLSFNWKAGAKWNLRAAAGQMTQYVHLLSNGNLGLPTDLWIPSTQAIQPERSLQFSLGAEWQPTPAWGIDLEGYYKKMDNLLNLTEGSEFLDEWENNVTAGSGIAYGVDLLLQKKTGKTQGWVSYSLGRTTRMFNRINLGAEFPFRYDHRHDLKVVVKHALSRRMEFSANWVFSSGLAFSLPQESYGIQFPGVGAPPVTAVDYGSKNEFRMPAYHRLDLSLNYQFASPGLRHLIHVGVYNLYNRANPVYYSLDSELRVSDGQLREYKELNGFELLPLLPSLSYSVKF